jgi:predicted transcriptional regulator
VSTVNRGKHEIYRDVLAFCCKGEIKTELMSKCRLSWAQVKDILPFLISKGFLQATTEEHPDGNGHMRLMKVYRTTREGVVLLMALENVDFILGTEYAMNILKIKLVANAKTEH